MRAIDLDGDAMHRMISRLQTFLNRMCNHPLVFNSPALLNFFTEGNGEVFAASCAKPPEAPSPGTAAAAVAAAGKEGGGGPHM